VVVAVKVITGGGGARVMTGVSMSDAGVAVGAGEGLRGIEVGVHSTGVDVGREGRGITVTASPQIMLKTTTTLNVQKMT
jgi:hypothetical protein